MIQRAKPAKPYPEFPLFAHATGQWAKKIRGRFHYFGPWEDWRGARDRYLAVKDYLHAGRPVPTNTDGLTVGQLAGLFLTSKKRLCQSGEVAQRTLYHYKLIIDKVVAVLGSSTLVEYLQPIDFEKLRAAFAKTHGPTRLRNDIGVTRMMFKYGFDTFEVSAKYGQSFRKPTKPVLRRLRQKRGPRMFTAEQLRAVIDAAGVQLRAMIYLGINCGFGNHDCALLTFRDMRRGWIEHARPKTGIDRRCPLWPETVKAIKAAIANRPEPKDEAHKERVFITKYGQPWDSIGDSPISKEFAKLLKALKLHRKGVGFYALRHTFQTIGAKSRDKDAVKAIMGHADDPNDMGAVYNEEPIDDERLQAVVDYVRAWLFAKVAK